MATPKEPQALPNAPNSQVKPQTQSLGLPGPKFQAHRKFFAGLGRSFGWSKGWAKDYLTKLVTTDARTAAPGWAPCQKQPLSRHSIQIGDAHKRKMHGTAWDNTMLIAVLHGPCFPSTILTSHSQTHHTVLLSCRLFPPLTAMHMTPMTMMASQSAISEPFAVRRLKFRDGGPYRFAGAQPSTESA